MSSSGFEKLPTEILRLIVGNLNPETGSRTWIRLTKLGRNSLTTVCSLCLTSKKAYSAAMPVLYYSLPFLEVPIQLVAKRRPPENHLRWKRRVERFLRSITENDALGQYVRAATFTRSILFRLIQVPGLFRTLAASASVRFPGTADRIRQEGSDDISSAMVTLLVAMMPNLTQLMLRGEGLCLSPQLLNVLGVQSMRIQSLQVSGKEERIVQFLNMLPDLESLDLDLALRGRREADLDERVLSDEAWQALSPLPKLTVLRLAGLVLPKPMLLHLLANCNGRLEVFSFIIEDDCGARPDSHPIASIADAMQGLKPHYDSLKSVELCPSPYADWPLAGPDLGCFSQLHSLSLTIPPTCSPTLPFWKTLPRTLRHLEITVETSEEGDKEVIAKLMILAEGQLQRPKPYPWLNRVECNAGGDEMDWIDLNVAFACVDIVFSTSSFRLPGD